MALEIAIVSKVVAAGSTPEDFTQAGFGNPQAAIIKQSFLNAIPENDPHGFISINFTDFTRHRGGGTSAENGQVTTDSWQRHSTVTLYSPRENSGSSDWAATASVIADGLRLTFSDTTGFDAVFTVIMFKGASNVHVNGLTSDGTQDTETNETNPNFKPDIIFGSNCKAWGNPNALDTDLWMQFGMAVRQSDDTFKQCGLNVFGEDGVGTTNWSGIITNADGATQRIFKRSSGEMTSLEITGALVNGFKVTTRDANASSRMAYLAIKLDTGDIASINHITSPTGIGNQSYTGFGLTPHTCLGLISFMTALDTDNNNDAGAKAGLNSFNATDEVTHGIAAKHNVATSSTRQFMSENAIQLSSDVFDTFILQASFVSLDDDGITLNFTTVDASARQIAILGIGPVYDPPTPPSATAYQIPRIVGITTMP